MNIERLKQLPSTPMWIQYAAIKAEALDALLFYRMGDFYELFLEDAVEASAILGITLTARNKGESIPIPMCGVPFHSSASYINRLLKVGKRVAICEQTEEAGATKGIVKREIVRVVSPGMAFDPDTLDSAKNHYLLALDLDLEEQRGSYALADISTGSLEYSDFLSLDQLRDDLSVLQPGEILIPASLEGDQKFEGILKIVGKEYFPCITSVPDFYYSTSAAAQDLCRHFGVLNLEGFGLAKDSETLKALGAVFRRIRDTQKLGDLSHLQPPKARSRLGFVQMDESTMEHLDLFPKPGQNPEDSCFHHLNKTSTAMGARKLREIFARPLSNLSMILYRQKGVEELVKNDSLRRRIQDSLSGIRDLERLLAKVGLETANPRDLQALLWILERIPALKGALRELATSAQLQDLENDIQNFEGLKNYLGQRLKDEVPAISREGNIFRTGWNQNLDELIGLSENARAILAEMEEREKQSTGISSLKIKFNKVFGYYIEITNSNLANVPKHYVRKQTTANSERFLTDELKKFEEKTLSAEEKRIALEESLFKEALRRVASENRELLQTAAKLALLDALTALAQAARDYGYVAPELTEDCVLDIEEGRHPALEHLVGRDKFIPNSIHFQNKEKIFLLTGPNMAGKSTYMRQVALITLMAHMGSFVPAKKATIGLVDRVATRVGASDRIGRGQSTFMVEMNEMAKILRQSTTKSLLIIDEIGRGTSTYDGLAIAWAILEDLADRLQCRSLFATHYHELTALESRFSSIKNLNVAVEERDGEILFLHEVRRGKASGSYGVEVARLAGLPQPVISRAKTILDSLEKGSGKMQRAQKEVLQQNQQLDFFSLTTSQGAAQAKPAESAAVPAHLMKLESLLREFDLNKTTPIEALLAIQAWKDNLPQSNLPC
jgi:DNA mismatch repair protein MutS